MKIYTMSREAARAGLAMLLGSAAEREHIHNVTATQQDAFDQEGMAAASILVSTARASVMAEEHGQFDFKFIGQQTREATRKRAIEFLDSAIAAIPIGKFIESPEVKS